MANWQGLQIQALRLSDWGELIGVDEGLKHDSAIHCDELVSLRKAVLTDYVGTLSSARVRDLNIALAIALELA